MPEPLKLQDIKLRMQAYGIRPSKKLGQNLLADFNLLDAIVADADVDPADLVLEIGTGAGSLTGLLCDAAGLVLSVEIDEGMFGLSRDILTGTRNLIQFHADALPPKGRGLNPELEQVVRACLDGSALPELPNLHAHFQGKPPRCGELKMVANLPYSVATTVIIAALESELPFERMLVMVQHEVAEKLAARPGDRLWGLPALLRHQFADARIVRKVPSRVFWPRPNVDSGLLEITPRSRPDMTAYHRLRQLAHLLFQSRRKHMNNALAIALGVDSAQAAAWLQAADADPALRPEQTPVEALQRLADNPDVEQQARKAMQIDEDQLAQKAAKAARQAEWKRRVYGE
jgi:16S rRNA (adenine1518-N6/adenine1519-N6)-dimethyltransferase